MLQAFLLGAALWILTALLVAVARRFAVDRDYWKKRGVAFEPPSAIFGSIRDVILFRTTWDEWLSDLYARHAGQPVVGFWRLRAPALLVRDPGVARALLIGETAALRGRGVRLDEAEPLCAHLLALEGPRWRLLRARLSPFGSARRLRAMLPTLNALAAHTARALHAARATPVDVLDQLHGFTSNVVGACAYGLEESAMARAGGSWERFHEAGRRVSSACFGAGFRRALRLLLPSVARALAVRQFPKDVSAFFLGMVAEELDRREREEEEARAKGEAPRPKMDFMQLLLDIRRELRASRAKAKGQAPATQVETEAVYNNNEGETPKKSKKSELVIDEVGLTEEVLAAQAFVFLVAGLDSPTSVATNCLFELARHPLEQRKAREDVLRALRAAAAADCDPDSNTAFSYEALLDMKYLDMVIEETLRLTPSSGQLIRECSAPCRVPGTDLQLEPGTFVFVSVLGLHNDPRHFPEPHVFRPERFSAENRASIQPYTYVPFGIGPRACSGERFARLQMKVVLARILLDFDVQPCAQTPHALAFDPHAFALRLASPMWLRFVPRHAAAPGPAHAQTLSSA